jgi:uncharacterized membrane protein
MAFCSGCGTAIPDGTSTCAACSAKAPAVPAGGGMTDNVAGMLCYILIVAIIFLLIEPYNKSKFVRFHAFQCIFLCVAWVVLGIALSIFGMIPVIGWATLLLWPIIGLAGLVLWIVLFIKAYQGQMFKVPFIGDLAMKQAGA